MRAATTCRMAGSTASSTPPRAGSRESSRPSARSAAPEPRADLFARAAEELRARPSLGHVAIDAGADEFVVLLARAGGGRARHRRVADRRSSLTERAIRRAAA
ncbi:MAG: hypothetical protein WDN44_15765 [Sphingomonas sp.]